MHSSRLLAGVTALVYLTGCSLFAGVAVLAQGGSAADAATAIFFALSVTYPVAAGIGGGGICVVHDPARTRDETFDFLARNAARGGDYAVPGSVGGFAMLQSAYGRLPWQRVVAPAEGFAAAGFRISHALATRLEQSQDVIRLDAGLAAEFLDESGRVKPPNTLVISPTLAQTLSAIRSLGPNGFYRGPVADKIVAYSTAQGGTISAGELEAFAPGRSATRLIKVGGEMAYLPSENTGAGRFAGALLSHLVDGQGNIVSGDNFASTVATATKTTLDTFGIASLPRDLGATGFAATDSSGQAVACAVSMNGPFGSGHTAEGTGVTLAHAPGSGQAAVTAEFLTPVVALSGSDLSLVGAGAGGPNGAAAIAYALLKIARGEDITQPGALHSTGIAPYDTVNVIACQSGSCSAVPDPGAFGLGASADE